MRKRNLFKMKKSLIIIGITILILAFPLYQLYALNTLVIQNFTIEYLSINHRLEFVLEGSFEIYNPHTIPLTIKQIEYIGAIKEEQLFEGAIQGATIPAKQAVSFSFNQTIDWVPDQETMLEILEGKEVPLHLEAEVDASFLYLFTMTGKKEISFDVADLLKPYVEEQIKAITGKVTSFLFS